MAERVGVGLLGLGTVGTAVARRLVADFEVLTERCGGTTPVLRHVAVRDAAKPRDVELPAAVRLSRDPMTVVDDPAVQVVVEVLGDSSVAAACIERAAAAGKPVVTANKAVMALQGPALLHEARRGAAGIWHEGCVCAGLPVVQMLRDGLAADRVSRLSGIVNATTNVVLTRMRNDGVSLDEALLDAQRRGFAEADASSDIDGWDAAYKIVLLAWLAFGVHVDPRDVDRRGIRDIALDDIGYAGRLGHSVKLLAAAECSPDPRRVHLRVRPTLVPAHHPLHAVDDDRNMVIVDSDLAGTVAMSGVAAGGASTASAVLSDVVHAVRGDAPPRHPASSGEVELMSDEEVEVCGYLRVVLSDIAEARQLVVQALEDRGVPVVDAVAARTEPRADPQLVILTGTAPRAVHDRAVETLETITAVDHVAAALDRIE